MIPSNAEILRRTTPELCYEVLMNPKNYFSMADEYVSLQKIFLRDTLLGKLELWFEMIISPIIMIGMSLWEQKSPDMFQMMSTQKCFQLWKDWFRMRELREQIHMWIRVIRKLGGPFISSNDAQYHVFVYADAMQRLMDSLLLPKERAKRL
jgi:hypothetical protein